ncbi:MAG: cupin-like domain-containing protein [Lysobacter sp.]
MDDSTGVLRGFDEASLDQASMERLLVRKPFVFAHHLVDHPALSIENLAAVIPQLPDDQVFHSNGRLTYADNLDRAHREHSPEQGLHEALQRLREVDAYIMVRKPETHPSFQPLFRMIEAEVMELVRATGQGADLGDAKLYLFIASPNSVTPFHIDRYSTVLMQIRGTKEVVVYPPWDQQVVSDEHTELYFSGLDRPPWRPEAEPLGQRFDFKPGEALHIPFAAGHHVRNGSDDISISLSIIFNSPRSQQLIQALRFNQQLRVLASKIGLQPGRVALDASGVALKSSLWTAGRSVARLLRPMQPG